MMYSFIMAFREDQGMEKWTVRLASNHAFDVTGDSYVFLRLSRDKMQYMCVIDLF